MNERSPADPVLAHVEPVPGGLYGDQPYEAAHSDLRLAAAKVSAALRDAEDPRAEQLARFQRDLNRAQLQARPDHTESLERGHALVQTVRRYLADGGAA
ncbi:hypothetical protein [Streptomyces sp. MNP-20]|uniref:hypothetical protein n=1 Tax=Streptomyces sp. MNP-20 TaxID=2721165 RepID=UPI0015569C25|nr:hypothetical protein [Streptomyces sp. MNP-20]